MLDPLRVEKVGLSDIQVGDVIVFRTLQHDAQIVHRVVAKRNDRLITRGDAHLRRDRWWLSPDQVIGRVTEVQREKKWYPVAGGRAAHRAQQRRWWGLLIKSIPRAIMNRLRRK